MQTTTGGTMTSRYARWVTPAVGLTIGIAYLAAGWVGGNLLFGLLDRRDERIVAIDWQATAVAGAMLIVAVIAAFVVEIARGQDGMPYAWLGALGGVTYALAVLVLRLRG